MIPGGDPYGWGVFSVPMPHEVRPADPAGTPLWRLLFRDVPWRNVLFSVVMTCLAGIALLLFGRSQPAPLLRPEPPPVEVTVLLREEVKIVPPPAVVTTPPPKPMPVPKPAVKPPPKPPEPQVVRPAPAPPVVRPVPAPPPKPQPLRPPPTEAPLPQPAQMARLPQRQAPATAMPQRQADMKMQAEAVLPVAPSAATYQQNPRSTRSAEMPQQATTFRTEAPVAGLAVQPATGRVAERAADRPSLPKSAASAFGTPAREQLATVDTGLSQTRYATPSAAASMPAPAPSRAVTTGRGGDPAVAAPQARGLRTDLGARKTEAPAMERSAVAFAGAGGEPTLSGPAAAAIQTTTTTASALPAGGSFDFLDLMAPADLDQSVLVSLNKLRTCRDPAAENRLKTKLAALLNGPARCRAGGVVFAIRNPESAYSIHVDLYNYEQREFRDRCDALELAVRSCETRR